MNKTVQTTIYLGVWLLALTVFVTPFFFTKDRDASVKEHLVRPDGTILKSLFTPYDNIRELLVSLIGMEQKSIHMMAYLLSDRHVVNALQDAVQQRHIEVIVITDYETANNKKYNFELHKLSKTINLRIFQPLQDGIMHNKFIIFERSVDDKPLIWTGSFNFTLRAQQRNIENALVCNDPQIVAQYQEAFNKLIAFSTPSEQVFSQPNIQGTKPKPAPALG